MVSFTALILIALTLYPSALNREAETVVKLQTACYVGRQAYGYYPTAFDCSNSVDHYDDTVSISCRIELQAVDNDTIQGPTIVFPIKVWSSKKTYPSTADSTVIPTNIIAKRTGEDEEQTDKANAVAKTIVFVGASLLALTIFICKAKEIWRYLVQVIWRNKVQVIGRYVVNVFWRNVIEVLWRYNPAKKAERNAPQEQFEMHEGVADRGNTMLNQQDDNAAVSNFETQNRQRSEIERATHAAAINRHGSYRGVPSRDRRTNNVTTEPPYALSSRSTPSLGTRIIRLPHPSPGGRITYQEFVIAPISADGTNEGDAIALPLSTFPPHTFTLPTPPRVPSPPIPRRSLRQRWQEFWGYGLSRLATIPEEGQAGAVPDASSVV